MIQRNINLPKTNSFFLFGARGSGKTSLLESRFDASDTLFVDLLDPEVFDEFIESPSRFRDLINSSEHKSKRVVVDEVQRIPALLDIVHSQIQKKKRQFILTGSSARRLKQKGTNLLAGRAWTYSLFPFTTQELGDSFELTKALMRGSLPDSWLAEDDESHREYLNAYIGTYLQKEIQQERWVRNLPPFRKFLAVAAQMNGKIVNKSMIGREIGVDDVTVANYFELLEDTQLGFFLPAFHKSVRKAQKQAPKFYFIDTGIVRALTRTLSVPLVERTSAFGDAFEHWVVLEIHKMISYRRKDWLCSFVRTKDDLEIDLVIDRPGQPNLLIEIKSKSKVSENDAKSLILLGDDIDPESERYLFSNDPLEQRFGAVHALHWQQGLEEIFEP